MKKKGVNMGKVYCANCSRLLPGGYIQVDNLENPHCVDCGRDLKSQIRKEKED